MKFTTPLISIAILAASSISATADIARCTGIENSLNRLACYDGEAGYNSEAKEEIVGSGDWLVRVETSKIDDSENVFLTLHSDEQTNCPYKNGRHSIHMACRENETNLWVIFGHCFMSSIQGKGRVTYRLGSDEAVTRNFRESNDNMALGLWSGGTAIPFIKEMIGHDQMIIRATPFSDSTVTGEYNISGLAKAVQPLRDSCNW